MNTNSNGIATDWTHRESGSFAVRRVSSGWEHGVAWIQQHKSVAVTVGSVLFALGVASVSAATGRFYPIFSLIPVLCGAWLSGVSGAAIAAVSVTLAYDVVIPMTFRGTVSLMSDGGVAITIAVVYTLASLAMGVEVPEPTRSDHRD